MNKEQVRRAKISVSMKKNHLKVTAECHSDDHAVECNFNAAKYFQKATADTIIELAECGWGGDYPADSVAEHVAGYDKDVADMFKYIEIRNKGGKREHIGFECHVNGTSALAWLLKNRPKVHAKVVEATQEDA